MINNKFCNVLIVYRMILFAIIYSSLCFVQFSSFIKCYEYIGVFLITIALIIYVLAGVKLKRKYIFEINDQNELKHKISKTLHSKRKMYYLHLIIMVVGLIITTIYGYNIFKTGIDNNNVQMIENLLGMLTMNILILYASVLCLKTEVIQRHINEKKSINKQPLPEKMNDYREIDEFMHTSYFEHIDLLPWAEQQVSFRPFWLPAFLVSVLFIIISLLMKDTIVSADWFRTSYKDAVLTTLNYLGLLLGANSILLYYVPYFKDYRLFPIYNKYSEFSFNIFVSAAIPFLLFYHGTQMILKLLIGYYILDSSTYSIFVNEWSFHYIMVKTTLLCIICFTSLVLRYHNLLIAMKRIKEEKEKNEENINEG